jgi:xanthine dehydrogenase accessory factor
MSVWPTIERFITEHGAAALVTLAEARGSSPRDAGARMVVRPDGGFTGTIGGGTLEWIALAEAQALLADRRGAAFKRLDKSLGPDLGQCCGGRVIVTLERFDARDREMVETLADLERSGPLVTVAATGSGRPKRQPAAVGEDADLPAGSYAALSDGRIVERFGASPTSLYLFGAGHVGRALALALAPLPFTVIWIDPRPGAFPSHVPANVKCLAELEPARLLAQASDGTLVAIMTHSHALDLDLTAGALKAGRFPYVGLIGSATKRARFVSAMRKIGITQDAIDRLICPIGLTEIQDKAPAAIAASIAAQLLIVRETVAAAVASDPVEVSSSVHSTRHA